jgi:hypothetical protein
MSRDENVEAWFRHGRKARVELPDGGGTIIAPRSAFAEPQNAPSVGEPTKSPEELAADGGADGQAGRNQEQQARSLDLNEAIRQGVGLRKIQKGGW